MNNSAFDAVHIIEVPDLDEYLNRRNNPDQAVEHIRLEIQPEVIEEINNEQQQLPGEMENGNQMEVINRLLETLTAKPNSDFQPTTYNGKDSENIQEWIESFNRIAAHNVWNACKQVEVISLYLKKAALTYYRSLNEETKHDADALKAALNNRFHTPEKQYTLRVDLFSTRQTDSLDEYIEKLDTLFNQLNTPVADRLHHFLFGLKTNLKNALLIRQPNTYDEAVTFARRKNRFSTDTESELV